MSPANRNDAVLTARQRELLSDLIDKCCASNITPAEAKQLDELLEGSSEARALYLDCLAVEAELHAGHAVAKHGGSLGQVPPPMGNGGLPTGRVGDLVTPRAAYDRLPRTRGSLLGWLTVAASLATVAMGSSWLTAQWLDRQPAQSIVATGDDAEAGQRNAVGQKVAEITATRNCRWRNASVGCGDQVCAGERLDLLQGVAELLFDSGVTVLLEGPATLEVGVDGSLAMLSGRLCVDSPEDAASLQIRAGRMLVAQSGASCGVLSDAVGGGEVHVFRGEVQATVFDDGGQQLHKCSLTVGSGGRLKPAARSFTPIRAHGDLFVRSLSPATGPQDGLYAFESFEYAAGPLSAQTAGLVGPDHGRRSNRCPVPPAPRPTMWPPSRLTGRACRRSVHTSDSQAKATV